MNNKIALQLLCDIKQLSDHGMHADKPATIERILRMPGFAGVTAAEVTVIFEELVDKEFIISGSAARAFILNAQKDGIAYFQALVNRSQQNLIDQSEIQRLTSELDAVRKANLTLLKSFNRTKLLVVFVCLVIGIIIGIMIAKFT